MNYWSAQGLRALMALLLGLAWVAPASPAGEAVTITWEDVRRAAEDHPALLAASSAVDEASGALRVQRQYANPLLGFGLGRAETVDGREAAGIWDVGLKIPIRSLGAYRGDNRAAAAERDAAVHDAAAVRLAVFQSLKEMFLRVAHDQDRLSALEASAAQLDALVDVARKRVEMGEARPLELGRFEIEAARIDLELVEAEGAARTRKEVLSQWLDSTLPGEYRVSADLSDLSELPPVSEAVSAAVTRHPAVASAGELLEAAAARLQGERWARFPTVEIGGFYEKELDVRNYGASLELEVPFWNWNSGRVAQAKAAEATARYSREMKVFEIEAAARESHAAAVSAYARAHGFRDVILPKAVEVAGAMEKMYQVGEVDIMNVLDARRRLIEIESDLLEAYLDSQLAYLRLATLMGDFEDD